MTTKKMFQSGAMWGLILFFILHHVASVSAQRRDRERQKNRDQAPMEDVREAPEASKSKLWFGGGVIIGFGGINGYSRFDFGLAPMLGYKLVGPLSAGPRVAYLFTSLKQQGFKALNLHNLDAGVFLRCRLFQGLFVQTEASNEWYQDLDTFTGEKFNATRANTRAGLGWNFAQPGGAGSEISILYNFSIANDLTTSQNPLEYRFGFTWRF